MSEDEVVVTFAEYASARTAFVLVAAANQSSGFSYRLSDGRRKAPDIVIYHDELLFVFEAKIFAKDLFREVEGRVSDADALIQLGRALDQQAMLVEEGRRKLRAIHDCDHVIRRVVRGLVAGDSLLPFADILVANDLLGIKADPLANSVKIEVVGAHQGVNFD